MKESYQTDLGTIYIEDDFVTLKTQRLTLKSINQIDEAKLLHDYLKLYGDSTNMQLFTNGNVRDEQTVKTKIDKDLDFWKGINHYNTSPKLGVFAIYLTQTNQQIGTLNMYYPPIFENPENHRNAVEFGYLIHHGNRKNEEESHHMADDQTEEANANWGKGYGKEMMGIGVRYTEYIVSQSQKLQQKAPDEIIATVDPANKASKRILKHFLGNKEPKLFSSSYNTSRRMFFKKLLPSLEIQQPVNDSYYVHNKL